MNPAVEACSCGCGRWLRRATCLAMRGFTAVGGCRVLQQRMLTRTNKSPQVDITCAIDLPAAPQASVRIILPVPISDLHSPCRLHSVTDRSIDTTMARTAQEVHGDDAHAPTTTIAPPPFNKSSADTVLRTADHVNFRVRRAILEEASVVFADMFLLPQPSPGVDTQSSPPLISLTESSKTIEALLRICYPVSDPEFISLDELKPVLEAARKYQMDHVIEVLNKPLVLFAVAHPLQAYAVAVQFDLVDAARAAARLTLRYKDPCPFTRELDAIPATAYYHLQAYRCKCAEAACQAVRDLRWLDSASFVWFKMQTSCACSTAGSPPYFFQQGIYAFSTRWFQTFLDSAAVALSARPYGGLLTGEEIGLGDQMCQDAASCSTCKTTVHSDTRRFLSKLAAEVDTRVSTARISSQSIVLARAARADANHCRSRWRFRAASRRPGCCCLEQLSVGAIRVCCFDVSLRWSQNYALTS